MLEYGGLVEGKGGTIDVLIPWVPYLRKEMEMNELTCNLAAYAHEAWSGWMEHLFNKCTLNDDGSVTIPVDLVVWWKRQMGASYKDLPADEQISDVAEAHKMIAIFDDWTS